MPSVNSDLAKTLYDLAMHHLSKLDEYIPGPQRRIAKGGSKLTLLQTYQADPVFSIFGLDSDEYIAATLSGGTITSIHRKLGDIYEEAVKYIFTDTLGVFTTDLSYSASIVVDDEVEERSLDVYVQFDKLQAATRTRVSDYCYQELLKLSAQPQLTLKGIGMEIRHCYQTGDSKRTQADEAMARHLLVSGILPAIPFFCNQSNRTVVNRYRTIWLVKEGMESYELIRAISGFDYLDFLRRNREDFRKPVINKLRSLTK